MDTTYDVAVVGNGMFGAAASRQPFRPSSPQSRMARHEALSSTGLIQTTFNAAAGL